jgi:hypothetical protein
VPSFATQSREPPSLVVGGYFTSSRKAPSVTRRWR